MSGLKDNEIAGLVNAVVYDLKSRIDNLPQCTRDIVSRSVVEYLVNTSLTVTKPKEDQK